MSGRDLVEDLRSGAKPLPRAARTFGALDLIVGCVAVIAVIAAGYFSYTTWISPHAPRQVTPGPKPALVATAAHKAAAPETWTAADDSSCIAKARAEANSDAPRQVISPNPSLAPGFAGMATLLECKLTRKVARFCAPDGKATLVEAVNDYLTRTDLIIGALGLQGAPMAIVGQFMGGEAAAGSDIYEAQRNDVLDFMQVYNKRVATALKALARDGLIAPADFGGFLGGPPDNIKVMFGTTQPERNICA